MVLRHLFGWQELAIRARIWEREDSAIFGCSPHWHGEWRNRKTNLTAPRQRLCISFAPYIHKSLITALCYRYVYFYTCLRWYQSVEVRFLRRSSSFVSPVTVWMVAFTSRMKKKHTSIPRSEKDCQRALPLDPFHFSYKQLQCTQIKALKVQFLPRICHIYSSSFCSLFMLSFFLLFLIAIGNLDSWKLFSHKKAE